MKPKFEIVTYANGESTLKDTESLQEMHSRVGPWTEAQTVYAQASRIMSRFISSRTLVLHDVGMGTGSNALAALHALETAEIAPGSKLVIESFETKIDGARFALANLERFPFLAAYADRLTELLEKRTIHFSQGILEVEWRLFEGDYYECLPHARKPDLIFYDFYAPKSVPELWTEEKFTKLRQFLGDHDCELYTYSAATPVRIALLLAGFYIGQGSRTRIKAETTAAATRYELLENPCGQKWLDKLDTSTSLDELENSAELRARGKAHPQWRRELQ